MGSSHVGDNGEIARSIMPLVITACTSRKRIAPAEGMSAATLAVGSLATVSRAWAGRLRKAARVAPAWQLYCGLSFSAAPGAARTLGRGLAYVSVGLARKSDV